MGPTGNSQGSYKYFALGTRKKITRPQATPIPMMEDIIKWVEKSGISQKVLEVLEFTTNAGEIVEVGDEYEESYHEGSEGAEFFPTALPHECVGDDDNGPDGPFNPHENLNPPILPNPTVPAMFGDDRSAEAKIGDEDADSSHNSSAHSRLIGMEEIFRRQAENE